MKKLLFIALIAMSCTMVSRAQQSEQIPYVEVNGSAFKMVEPNRIEVAVCLNQADSKGKISMAELESNLAKALKAANIDAKTDLVLINQSTAAHKRNTLYEFKNYKVTLTTAAQVEALFDAFTEFNVQNTYISRQWNDKQSEIEVSLKVQAMKNAQTAATILAEALGQSIGKAIQITDYSGNNYVTLEDNVPMLAAKRNSSLEELPAAKLQDIRVTQNVRVRFLLNMTR